MVMKGMIVFQSLWCLGLEWDALLPSELQEEASRWLHDLPALSQLCIPCSFSPLGWWECEVEHHGFADGSEWGYGACAERWKLFVTS